MVNCVTFEFYEIVGDKLLDVSVYKDTVGEDFRYNIYLKVLSDELKVTDEGDQYLMHEKGQFAATTMEDFFVTVNGILKPFYKTLKS